MNKKENTQNKKTSKSEPEIKKKAVFKKKTKLKKNISNGIAYVSSTFNNTIISIADENCNVVSWS